MFLERVPIHPELIAPGGSIADRPVPVTPAQIFAEYGIPIGRLAEVIQLQPNGWLRQVIAATGRAIEPGADLLRMDTSRVPGGATLCLPIDDIPVTHTANPSYDPNGLRPQLVVAPGTVPSEAVLKDIQLNRQFLKKCTHGLKVRFERGGPLTCNRIRWIQTVKKHRSPFVNEPREFVDVGGTSRGESWPWYHFGTNPDPLVHTDEPCGPEAPATGQGMQFFATTSVAVWTMRRITLVRCISWAIEIGIGKSPNAVHMITPFRPATGGEIQEQINILKAGINQHQAPTGGNLIYRPPPSDGSINEGI